LSKTTKRSTSQATATVSISSSAAKAVSGVQVTGQWSVKAASTERPQPPSRLVGRL
jgi:hypothetical protein